ncbi:hypothetical protein BN873_p20073 [Candidatus Competibacter denitrificans Run_A_D11]|uniref:Uncharacterized protein n=1 Tax=Candidatus Competibacter denitrificans Run_A_D11 TaxID=1400863 RepID=W6MEI9_9GAMM|nr:hypothetical protein BN873_p20073 [Candidatus Competibacter denitrificans Run_A_D11]
MGIKNQSKEIKCRLNYNFGANNAIVIVTIDFEFYPYRVEAMLSGSTMVVYVQWSVKITLLPTVLMRYS